jgi:sulfatase maturation enzyme AslB (radical SAM superfamily)
LLKYKEIFLGGRCNNNCLYCPPLHKDSPQADFNQIVSLLKLKEENENICFYGGEPTLRSDLFNIIGVAAETGYRRIKLSTNGMLLAAPGYAEELIGAGCRMLEIAVWGPNPNLHDYLTKTRDSYLQVMQGLENLSVVQSDKFVTVVLPLCRENYRDLENMTATVLNFGIHRIIARLTDPALSFADALPHVRNAINISIFNRTWFLTEGIPLCLLGGFEPHVNEIYSQWKSRYGEAFTRHRYCTVCAHQTFCPGVDERHVRTFGDREFAAVSAGSRTDDIKRLYE